MVLVTRNRGTDRTIVRRNRRDYGNFLTAILVSAISALLMTFLASLAWQAALAQTWFAMLLAIFLLLIPGHLLDLASGLIRTA